jgi:hypothetical protein
MAHQESVYNRSQMLEVADLITMYAVRQKIK